MNIVLYKGNFSYNVVNYFIDELAIDFKNNGHTVYILDLTKWLSEPQSLIDFLINNKTDMVIAFNCIGILGDNTIYDKIGVTYCGLLIDNPFYHYSRLESIKSKKSFFTIHDEGFINIAEKYISQDKIYSHLMHGGSFSNKINDSKIYDVVVMGSLHKKFLDLNPFLDSLPSYLKSITEDFYDMASNNLDQELLPYLEKAISNSGLPQAVLDMPEFNSVISIIYTKVDINLRQNMRYNAILKLLKNNIKVDYFGNCDIEELNSFNNFINHGSIDYKDILDILAQSKILIHDICYFKNGSHERVFSAMLNKALVISNDNNYSYNMYKDGESIVYYNPNDLDDVVNKVNYYLSDETKRNDIINNAYNITSTYNTWKNRADELIKIYNSVQNL